jgi:hypothetical protein
MATASRSRAEAGLAGRVAQPLRATLWPCIIDRPCGNRCCRHVRSGQDIGFTRYRLSGSAVPFRLHNACRPEPIRRLRHRGRRTSHPVAAHRGWHQNPSYSRSSGSEGRNQSLSRHLAARTLCGAPAEIGQGSASRADGSYSVTVARCVRPLSTPHPPVLLRASRSARARSATCVRARQCQPVRGTNGSAHCQADASPTTRPTRS